MTPMQIGLDLRLVIGEQIVPIHIDDVDKVIKGEEAFYLAIPQGIVLHFDALMTVLHDQFGFDVSALPAPVKGLLGNTSITLNEFYYKSAKAPVRDQTGKVTTPGEGDFKASITVAFYKGGVGEKGGGGLLADLIGVDMSALIDIKEVTVILTQGNVPANLRLGSTPAASKSHRADKLGDRFGEARFASVDLIGLKDG